MAVTSVNQSLTIKTNNQLNEISEGRKAKGEMHLKKHIMAEAIEALHKKELKNAKSNQ